MQDHGVKSPWRGFIYNNDQLTVYDPTYHTLLTKDKSRKKKQREKPRVCGCVGVVKWHPIQDSFRFHAENSWDRLWTHRDPDQDKAHN